MADIPQQIVLPRTVGREGQIDRIARVLRGLSMEDAWRVEIHRHKPLRSLPQNRTLWGIIYPQLLTLGGEALAGTTPEELHDYLLGEHYGWETVTIFGRRKVRPLRRSSKMNKQEFSDHMEFILRFAAERGMYIAMPDEMEAV